MYTILVNVCDEVSVSHLYLRSLFIFNVTATAEIYTLSLHDALPICPGSRPPRPPPRRPAHPAPTAAPARRRSGPDRCADRKSTRLNSSHANISYAVFCLKKKEMTKNLVNNVNSS